MYVKNTTIYSRLFMRTRFLTQTTIKIKTSYKINVELPLTLAVSLFHPMESQTKLVNALSHLEKQSQ